MERSRMIGEKESRIFIKLAWILALISGVITLMVTLFASSEFVTKSMGLSDDIGMYRMIDVSIFFILAYGIYKKSRTCAIILFAYHITNRYYMWESTHDLSSAFGLVAVTFLVIYFLGILGTFAHHAIQKDKEIAGISA